MVTGPPTGSEVSRDRYTGREIDEVEAFLRGTYTELSLHSPHDRPGERSRFCLQHDTLAAPAAGVAINHLASTLTLDATVPPRGYIAVDDLQRGRMSWSTRDGHREHQERFTAGEVALAPVTDTEFRHTLAPDERHDVELDIVALDVGRVADHAVHTCGLSDAAPVFTDPAPLSAELGRHWRATVAHVRDDILAHPEAAASPLLCATAFRLLASTLLTTFPNTALDAASDPHRAQETGDPAAVSHVALRAVEDYLEAHADHPLGPGDVADVAGAPYREVDAALRRRHDTHPARLLWRARLRGARRDLHDADPTTGPAAGQPDALVAATAARWGFSKLATFTVAYTAATGETPDHTLRES